jgi:hypothetical protein
MGRRRRHDRLWASELAQFTRCEQKALFERRRRNVRRTPEECARLREGTAVHAVLHRDAVDTERLADRSASDPRCFIASVVYGPDAPETRVLRALRDRMVGRSRIGAAVVGLYYILSPRVAGWLEGSPRARALVRHALDRLFSLARKMVDTRV